MDQTFLLALAASTLSSIGGLAGGLLLIVRQSMAERLSHYLIGFAAGVLLSVTFFDLLPEAFESTTDARSVLFFVLIGVILFFLIERGIVFSHSHEREIDQAGNGDAAELGRVRPLVILGDTVHNFIDGVVVAATFVVSTPIGIATAISVFFHELPQEIADFAVLLRSGMRRNTVFLVNFLSAFVAPLGTVLGYFYATRFSALQLPLLAVAAGSLLYLAMSALIPHLHHERRPSRAALQILLFLIGLSIFFVFPSA